MIRVCGPIRVLVWSASRPLPHIWHVDTRHQAVTRHVPGTGHVCLDTWLTLWCCRGCRWLILIPELRLGSWYSEDWGWTEANPDGQGCCHRLPAQCCQLCQLPIVRMLTSASPSSLSYPTFLVTPNQQPQSLARGSGYSSPHPPTSDQYEATPWSLQPIRDQLEDIRAEDSQWWPPQGARLVNYFNLTKAHQPFHWNLDYC